MNIVKAPIGHDQDNIAPERGTPQISDDVIGVLEMTCILTPYFKVGDQLPTGKAFIGGYFAQHGGFADADPIGRIEHAGVVSLKNVAHA